MIPLADHITAIAALVGEEPSADALAEAMAGALRALDRAAPRKLSILASVEDLAIPLPDDWEDGISRVLDVEHPADQVPPLFLSIVQWRAMDGQIKFAWEVVTEGDQVRLHYTTGHICDDVESSVPETLVDGLRAKAAAKILRDRANATAGEEDSTIQADMVNHGSKSSRYAKRAGEMERIWTEAIAATQARGAFASAELPDRFPRLTRPSRSRLP
jgi:hypothetical protein